MREVVVVVVVVAVVVVTFFSKTLAIEERGQLTAAAPTAWQADKQPAWAVAFCTQTCTQA